jgi:predicted transcriptional regulator
MDTDSILNECKDPKQSITVELPCAMAERAVKLAREKETSLSNIIIEALDNFLRHRK